MAKAHPDPDPATSTHVEKPVDQPAAAPTTEASATPAKAQSERGPTTYGGPNGPVEHGPDDPETKAAYAAGHPAHGLEYQRAQADAKKQG